MPHVNIWTVLVHAAARSRPRAVALVEWNRVLSLLSISRIAQGLTVTVLTCCSCSDRGQSANLKSPGDATASRSGVTLDDSAVEPVFRWMIDNLNERGEKPQAFFIEGPGESEPTAQLLSRLATPGVLVTARSKCMIREIGSEPFDPESGAVGVILTVKDAKTCEDGGVEVRVFRFCGELCGKEGALILDKKEGTWKVRRFLLRGIS
jgi:hypothetical protein